MSGCWRLFRQPGRICRPQDAHVEHIGIQAGIVLVTELQLCPMQVFKKGLGGGWQPGSYNIQKSEDMSSTDADYLPTPESDG
ncbi:hypothetical protein WJX77_012151 [Trebouxia sp. C0004]